MILCYVYLINENSLINSWYQILVYVYYVVVKFVISYCYIILMN